MLVKVWRKENGVPVSKLVDQASLGQVLVSGWTTDADLVPKRGRGRPRKSEALNVDKEAGDQRGIR